MLLRATAWALVIFAAINTALFILGALGFSPGTVSSTTSSQVHGGFIGDLIAENPVLSAMQARSVLLTPASWIAVAGVWVWKGRVRSKWKGRNLDRGVFNLMLRTKGGKSRESILRELTIPKDRLQLAKALELNWKTVDYHIGLLMNEGLIQESGAYGNVRLYRLTSTGTALLQVLGPPVQDNHPGAAGPNPNGG